MAPATPSSSTPSSKGKAPVPPKDRDGDERMDASDDEYEEELRELRAENERLSAGLAELSALGTRTNAAREEEQRQNEERFEQLHAQLQAPPSNPAMDAIVAAMERKIAELTAELVQTKNNQERQAAQLTGYEQPATVARIRDVGETIKPEQPPKFDGNPKKLQEHLTSLKSYHMYYPSLFTSNPLKVRHAMGRLEGKAAQNYESILKDFVTQAPSQRKPETTMMFDSFDRYEQSLIDNYGEWDEKHDALNAIRKLKQTKAASEYLSEFRYIAAKLNWSNENLIDEFYRNLKDDVKDELVKNMDPPTDFAQYAKLAVMIDNRLFERRMEKRNVGTNNSGWKRKNYANQGKPRTPNTSYGTAAGPMELGAMQQRPQQGKKTFNCYNCDEPGHLSRDCKKPRKEKKPFKPITTPTRSINSVKKGDDLPIRSINMTRSGFDGGFNGYDHDAVNVQDWMDELKYEDFPQGRPIGRTRPESKQSQEVNREKKRSEWSRRMEREKDDPEARERRLRMKREAAHRREAEKKREQEERTQEAVAKKWKPIPVGQVPGYPAIAPRPNDETHTIAMVRQLREPPTQMEDFDEFDIPDRQPDYQWTSERQPAIMDSGATRSYITQQPAPRPWVSAGRNVPQAREAGYDIEDKDILAPAEEYPESDDELRSITPEEQDALARAMEDVQIEQFAREQQDPTEEADIYIRALHRQSGMNPRNPRERKLRGDEPRTCQTHRKHDEISWASCVYHECATHLGDKLRQDCFPVRVNGQPIMTPYEKEDMEDYRVRKWYEHLGIAQLMEYDVDYPTNCQSPDAKLTDCQRPECQIHIYDKVNAWHEHNRRQTFRPSRDGTTESTKNSRRHL